jgi:hypothetical protein
LRSAARCFPAFLQLFAPQLQPTAQLLRSLEQRQQALLQGSGLSCAQWTKPSALLYPPMPLSNPLKLLLLLLLLPPFSRVCSCLRPSCSQPAS